MKVYTILLKLISILTFAVSENNLRANVCKNQESDDRTEISNFFLFYQTNLFSDLFSKIGLKGLISIY